MIAEDGGAAFPTTQYADQKPFGIVVGMTLRDYFAAHALSHYSGSYCVNFAEVARRCYDVADAMLKARTE